ncbi:hypothetical protein [[Clostridium] polysaccharolyticum]|uniref:Uncharacterized protein n=1 Tax=[Clostridium] polysaccharolyticum TaxID=29364 RepID=A0A1I0F7I0_9FIRM|nr:hypothetical protein [[Clostridium] polysaccharolyticum]SET53385.1 hypothetical protein SAMN04487772_12819 [[Clostridium] polysaccharolyticum]
MIGQKLPDDKETEWSYKEVCTYFGKNIALTKVPDNLKITTLKDPKIVYINENNEVTFDNIEITYQEKSILESGAYINILMSKNNIITTSLIKQNTVKNIMKDIIN